MRVPPFFIRPSSFCIPFRELCQRAMKPPDPCERVAPKPPPKWGVAWQPNFVFRTSTLAFIQGPAGSAVTHGFPDQAYNPTLLDVQFALQLTGPDPNTRHTHRSCQKPGRAEVLLRRCPVPGLDGSIRIAKTIPTNHSAGISAFIVILSRLETRT